MGPIGVVKVILGARRLEGYLKGGPVNGFDPRISIRKGALAIFKLAAGGAILGLVGALTDSEAVKTAFLTSGVPDAISAFIAMGIVAAGEMLRNAWINIDKGVLGLEASGAQPAAVQPVTAQGFMSPAVQPVTAQGFMSTAILDAKIRALLTSRPYLKMVLAAMYAILGAAKARGLFARTFGLDVN